MMHGQKNIKVP